MQKITTLLTIFFLSLTHLSFSQNTDSTKKEFHLKGAVTVTNKGISLVPTFTLGKPAAIFDLSLGKKKIFFEPQLRFGLGGKPWSFLFWWRYKAINNNKFALTLGAHPALNFRTDSFLINGTKQAIITSRRYLAGELAPNYFVSKNISVGLYYLYSRGFDYSAPRNNHFVTINSMISNIKLPNDLFIRLHPQVYYLRQDAKDGVYFTSTFTLSGKELPLSLQSIINITIETDIPGSKNVWNVSLIYSFNKSYVTK